MKCMHEVVYLGNRLVLVDVNLILELTLSCATAEQNEAIKKEKTMASYRRFSVLVDR